MPFFDGDNRLRVINTYCRAVGAIQLFYAWICFGLACIGLTKFAKDLREYQNGFRFKDYIPAVHFSDLAGATFFALLWVTALFGGCGLLLHQSWARRWEIAYLIFVSIPFVYELTLWAGHYRKFGHEVLFFNGDFGSYILFYMVVALPYVPFVFISPASLKSRRLGPDPATQADAAITGPRPSLRD